MAGNRDAASYLERLFFTVRLEQAFYARELLLAFEKEKVTR